MPAPSRINEDGSRAPPSAEISEHELIAPSATEIESHSSESLPMWEHDRDPPLEVIREHEGALLSYCKSVLEGDQTLREMANGPMEIELTDDAEPSAVTAARTMPYCWQENVKKTAGRLTS